MATRVALVMDSLFARRRLAAHLETHGDLRIAGQFEGLRQARSVLDGGLADVLILDLGNDRNEGLSTLEQGSQRHRLPVVVLAPALDADLDSAARRLGATAVIAKPGNDGIGRYHEELVGAIRSCNGPSPRRSDPTTGTAVRSTIAAGAPVDDSAPVTTTLLAIGASTGGTEAIRDVMADLPASLPGTVLIQHMPPGFTASFAERLNAAGPMRVLEAQGGELLRQGHAYLAPGGHHLVVRRTSAGFRLELDDGPRIHYQRPALDVSFHSIATAAGARAVGVILTGMGRDGAEGLLAMRRAGARTLGQDEGSSVVYGMPKMAHECGAVEMQVPLNRMAIQIVKSCQRLAGS